ncbi:hypothetical protein GF351_04030 [Candidatus Woesearchaeota archaeon]|nr:hypothetical protein [Candidatus Woesearchaeota archaeon]
MFMSSAEACRSLMFIPCSAALPVGSSSQPHITISAEAKANSIIPFFIHRQENRLIFKYDAYLGGLMQENENSQEPEKAEWDEQRRWKGPVRLLTALFLMLIIIMMTVPYYSIRMDPEPGRIMKLEEVQMLLSDKSGNETYAGGKSIARMVDADDPQIKLIADRIASSACGSEDVCQAKALFYFVRDELDYVSDPNAYEYVKPPALSIISGGGDCDDASVLLASLLEAVGIETRFAFVPGHVFVQARIPKALKRYRYEEDWVNLDPACSSCGFGEISYSVAKKEMTFAG